MKVAIGIPSYQESASISYITTQVDLGISRFLDIKQCTIVNIDSDSSDQTADIFLETPTRCNKKSFILQHKPRGKGRNLIHFFQYCLEENIDFMATIDADITTITPEWIGALLLPLIKGMADYVTPIYNRTKFGASITNHFAYPIVYGFYGIDMRQPIGGDFGFNRNLLRYLIRQIDSSFHPPEKDAVFKYGIDIFMSMHAVGGSFRVTQAPLGKKLHKPTEFSTLVKMFQEVSISAISVSRNYGFVDFDKNPKQIVTNEVKNQLLQKDKITEETYKNYHESQCIFNSMRHKAIEFEDNYQSWIIGDNRSFVKALKSEMPCISSEIWTDILSSFIAKSIFLDSNNIKTLIEQILPIFIMRAVTFWNQSVEVSSETIENNVINQSRLLRDKLLYLLKSETATIMN